jgi:hypothetical protein
VNEPTPNNGRPFYCATCGAGFGEFLACEEPDCQLETARQAKTRQRARTLRESVSQKSKKILRKITTR